MAAVAFDTYRVVNRLREAGFDERQAEAVTTAIQDSVTVDLSNLVTRDHFDERMKGVEDHVKGLDNRVKGLEAKIAESKADTLKSVMAMISGALAISVLTLLGSM